MSRARDDAKRNMRRQFATTHADGSPVGSYFIGYADGCVHAFRESGDLFAVSRSADHDMPEHTAWMSGPYSHQQWDELTTDYGWDDE